MHLHCAICNLAMFSELVIYTAIVVVWEEELSCADGDVEAFGQASRRKEELLKSLKTEKRQPYM
jgi:hypothetical protein